MKSFLYSVIITLLIVPATLFADEPLILNGNTEKVALGYHIRIYEDRDRSFTVEDVINGSRESIQSGSESPSFGFTNSAYWVKFSVRSELNSGSRNQWLLELDYALMDKITLYEIPPANENTARTTGYTYPFNSRDIKHRNFVFGLDIPPGSTKTVIMRFENEDRMEFPLTLWSQRAFQQKDHTQQYILGIYYGILLVMFFYNLFIFISIRDRSYLYYIAYILAFLIFQLTQNGIAYELLNGLIVNTHYIPQIGSVLMLTSVYFAESFLNVKTNLPRYYRLYPVMKILLMLSLLSPIVLSYSYSVLFYIFATILTIILIYSSGILCVIKGYRPSIYYTIAWSFVLFGGMIYAMKVLAVIPNNYFTTYAIQVGSALEVMLLSLGLGNKINVLREEKEKAQQSVIESQQLLVNNLNTSKKQIEEAHASLSISEEKYRILVENSSDIIFTLDENLKFINANMSIAKELRLNQDKISGLDFFSLLYKSDRDQNITDMLTQEKIDEFIKSRKPVQFVARFRSPISTEPKEMLVNLEFIDYKGKNEILGKASRLQDDNLLQYFRYENQKYSISNYLNTVEEITHRITRNLKRYLSDMEIMFIQIALREVIINSIEHGNLGITFQEKTDVIENDRYFEFIRDKQIASENLNKKVHIDYTISEDMAAFKISDEGDGFDHRKFIENVASIAGNGDMSHGRGLVMVMNVFDEVRFNSTGNQVQLIKYFLKN